MSDPTPALWDYSIALYDQEGVAPACLILQDQYGFDVNLVLFCLWYGRQYGKLAPETLAQALKISRHWANLAVVPLRNVRTEIKADKGWRSLPEAENIALLREQVKKLELGAEKIQQQMLERLARSSLKTREDRTEDVADAGLANLAMLVTAMDLELELNTQPQISSILAAREAAGRLLG